MDGSGVAPGEASRALDHDVDTEVVPRDGRRITGPDEFDTAPGQGQGPTDVVDRSGEPTVHGVELEQMRQRFTRIGVVDGDDLDRGVPFDHRADESSTDSTEAVDADSDMHDVPPDARAGSNRAWAFVCPGTSPAVVNRGVNCNPRRRRVLVPHPWVHGGTCRRMEATTDTQPRAVLRPVTFSGGRQRERHSVRRAVTPAVTHRIEIPGAQRRDQDSRDLRGAWVRFPPALRRRCARVLTCTDVHCFTKITCLRYPRGYSHRASTPPFWDARSRDSETLRSPTASPRSGVIRRIAVKAMCPRLG